MLVLIRVRLMISVRTYATIEFSPRMMNGFVQRVMFFEVDDVVTEVEDDDGHSARE